MTYQTNQHPSPANPTPPLKPRPKHPMGKPCPCGSGKKYKHCCYAKEKPGRWAVIIGIGILATVALLALAAVISIFS